MFLQTSLTSLIAHYSCLVSDLGKEHPSPALQISSTESHGYVQKVWGELSLQALPCWGDAVGKFKDAVEHFLEAGTKVQQR